MMKAVPPLAKTEFGAFFLSEMFGAIKVTWSVLSGHDFQVSGHVPGVWTFGVLGPMLLLIRIEMASGGLEIGSITLCIHMHVDGMLAFGKVLQVQFDLDAVPRRRQHRCSRILPLAGLKVHLQTLVFPQRRRSRQC